MSKFLATFRVATLVVALAVAMFGAEGMPVSSGTPVDRSESQNVFGGFQPSYSSHDYLLSTTSTTNFCDTNPNVPVTYASCVSKGMSCGIFTRANLTSLAGSNDVDTMANATCGTSYRGTMLVYCGSFKGIVCTRS